MQESCRPNHSIDVPTVSILIPCYNVAVTVNVSVASLLGQTLPEREIVAVDDSSTDTTGDHLAKWAGRNPRARVLSLPHRGLFRP